MLLGKLLFALFYHARNAVFRLKRLFFEKLEIRGAVAGADKEHDRDGDDAEHYAQADARTGIRAYAETAGLAQAGHQYEHDGRDNAQKNSKRDPRRVGPADGKVARGLLHRYAAQCALGFRAAELLVFYLVL